MAYRPAAPQGHQDRWCIKCQCSMELVQRQSCLLPARVLINDPLRRDVSNYGKYLKKVSGDGETPAGFHACGVHLYRCPECRRRKVRLTLFLPNGQESYLFERGELDSVFH